MASKTLASRGTGAVGKRAASGSGTPRSLTRSTSGGGSRSKFRLSVLSVSTSPSRTRLSHARAELYQAVE